MKSFLPRTLSLSCCLGLALAAAPSRAPAQQSVLDQRTQSVLNQLTDAEKITLLSSTNDYFASGAVPRVGVPAFLMMDGPHGVRYVQSTSFPVGIGMAATWDPDLGLQVGQAMGQEFYGFGHDQQLGPCVDMDRDPRFGRSPESGGEEPLLSARMGTAAVRGIQQSPVIATVKHLNGNGKENGRNSINVTISDRNLMEHYGLAFRTALQEGGALSIMDAYNLVDGTHCADSPYLLSTILRQRWGFPFYVVSDFGAVANTQASITAGNDVCMGSPRFGDDLPGLVSSGAVSGAVLNTAVANTLRVKLLNGMLDPRPVQSTTAANTVAHQQLARQAGREGIVLLKNVNRTLPLSPSTVGKIALVGPSANVARLDGAGSSQVIPPYSVSPLQGLTARVGAGNVTYQQGCTIAGTDTSGFAAAVSAAQAANVVVYVGGLDDTQEGEEYVIGDRVNKSVQLPGVQTQLIQQLAAANPNLIVILESGGICTVSPFVNNVRALLYAFYPGMEGGNALADVLFGDYNPAGHLPVTMPVDDSQLPVWDDNWDNDYLCGYRWYDQMGLTPQFAFGFGLSYTTFAYSNLSVSPASAPVGTPVTVSFQVTNTGGVAGDEVAQLYVTDTASPVPMPKKQLKGFQRLNLTPGQTKTVSFRLNAEDFYYWDANETKYTVAPGSYALKVGGSSDNLPLAASLTLTANAAPLPDLKITRVYTLPRCPQPGDAVTFYVLVKNQGAALCPGGNLAVTVAANSQPVAQNTSYNKAIPAGGYALLPVINGYWTAPADAVVPLTAMVNGDGRVAEADSTNNTYGENVTVATLNGAASSGDLALNQPTTASTQENATYAAPMATDGNSATRWGSAFNVNEQWLSVDLGQTCNLTGVRLNWEAAYSTDYSLQVAQTASDVSAGNWQEVKRNTAGKGGVETLSFTASARYIRLLSHQRSQAAYGVSLYDFNVYGTSSNPAPYLASLQITPGNGSVPLGQSATFAAQGFDQNGQPFTPTQPVVWLTSNGTVDGSGVLTPAQTGTATLTAFSGKLSATVTVAVTSGVLVPLGQFPGTVQAANFHPGGEGVGYHDTTPGNQGGAYRLADAVDIEPTSDSGGGYDVTYLDAGEWLEYNVQSAGSGAYTLTFRLASAVAGAKAFHLEIAGKTVASGQYGGALGRQTFENVTVDNVPLPNGVFNLRVVFDSPGLNFRSMTAALKTVRVSPSVPGKIEAEDYLPGGEGVGYHDTTPGNTPGQYRSDDVDIEACTDAGGGYDVGYTDVGEWLLYNVSSSAGGSYQATFRVASGQAGTKTLHLEVNGTKVATGTFATNNGWQSWQDLSLGNVTLPAGTSQLKVYFETTGINFNSLRLDDPNAQSTAITSPLNTTGYKGVPFSYQIAANNGPASYGATGLPPGLSLNPSTGFISGTPTAIGTYGVTITANPATTSGSVPPTSRVGARSRPLASASALAGPDAVSSSATLTITINSYYTAWQSHQFSPAELANPAVSGDNASPAGDGLGNLLKYALNLDPHVVSTGKLPVATRLSANGTSYLYLTYGKNVAVNDIVYRPEWTTDFVTWSDSGITETVLSDDGATRQVQDSVPANGNPRMFLRLRVTRP